MALSKGLRQLVFMLQGWVRHARRRYLALSALIFGGLLLASILVSQYSFHLLQTATPFLFVLPHLQNDGLIYRGCMVLGALE